MTKTIQIEKFDILLHENGILENITKGDGLIEIEDVKLLVKTNLTLSDNKHYVVLIRSDGMATLSNSAMDYTANAASSSKTIARAFVVKGLAERLISNFYIKMKRPTIKTKMFNERDKALEWLEEQLFHYKAAKDKPGVL